MPTQYSEYSTRNFNQKHTTLDNFTLKITEFGDFSGSRFWPKYSIAFSQNIRNWVISDENVVIFQLVFSKIWISAGTKKFDFSILNRPNYRPPGYRSLRGWRGGVFGVVSVRATGETFMWFWVIFLAFSRAVGDRIFKFSFVDLIIPVIFGYIISPGFQVGHFFGFSSQFQVDIAKIRISVRGFFAQV